MGKSLLKLQFAVQVHITSKHNGILITNLFQSEFFVQGTTKKNSHRQSLSNYLRTSHN